MRDEIRDEFIIISTAKDYDLDVEIVKSIFRSSEGMIVFYDRLEEIVSNN